MLTFFVYKTLNTFKDPKSSKASRCSREESCRKDGAGHAASLEIEREISSFENCQLWQRKQKRRRMGESESWSMKVVEHHATNLLETGLLEDRWAWQWKELRHTQVVVTRSWWIASRANLQDWRRLKVEEEMRERWERRKEEVKTSLTTWEDFEVENWVGGNSNHRALKTLSFILQVKRWRLRAIQRVKISNSPAWEKTERMN